MIQTTQCNLTYCPCSFLCLSALHFLSFASNAFLLLSAADTGLVSHLILQASMQQLHSALSTNTPSDKLDQSKKNIFCLVVFRVRGFSALQVISYVKTDHIL